MKTVQFLMGVALIFFNVAFAQNASITLSGQGSANLTTQNGLEIFESISSKESFCDVILVKHLLYEYRAITYSTFKVSECTVELIDALNSASVTAQIATLYTDERVLVRGPYYFTMDVNNTQVLHPYISIGNLRFSKMAVSTFTLLDAVVDWPTAVRWWNAKVAYNPTKTIQNLEYIWFSGKRVYLIRSDKGKVYVMSAVSHNIKNNKHGINLTNLGDYLNLPPGWTYESKVLNKVLSMKAEIIEGYSYKRMIDEFNNIYVEVIDPSIPL